MLKDSARRGRSLESSYTTRAYLPLPLVTRWNARGSELVWIFFFLFWFRALRYEIHAQKGVGEGGGEAFNPGFGANGRTLIDLGRTCWVHAARARRGWWHAARGTRHGKGGAAARGTRHVARGTRHVAREGWCCGDGVACVPLCAVTAVASHGHRAASWPRKPPSNEVP